MTAHGIDRETLTRLAATDEELVAAFQGGDTAAFDVLVARWDRKIRGAIYRFVGSPEEASDLSQEAFLRAFRGLGSFKRQARFSSWLYQIALNLCRDRMRRKRGRTAISFDDVFEHELPAEPGPSAMDRVVMRDLSERVRRAVASLPVEQREVIVLKEYEGLTFTEIAESLDVPVSTVKTRLYRALKRLRTHLERTGVAPAGDGPK